MAIEQAYWYSTEKVDKDLSLGLKIILQRDFMVQRGMTSLPVTENLDVVKKASFCLASAVDYSLVQ
ncbi:MAG: hypothetical protein MIO92_14445 [Methanosarcinaceae archaeon]|nr:hypothetical protein [Methanosarcinaceae archaeon]